MSNVEPRLRDMFKNTKEFEKNFEFYMNTTYAKRVAESSSIEKYTVLAKMVLIYSMGNWKNTRETVHKEGKKTLYYFSLEFLMGRLLSNNMYALGIHDVVKDGLKDLDINLDELEELESDAGLGNGGLGRLAACFLDSLATLDYAGNGNCIRYKNGLFKQLIINDQQVEAPDQWLRLGYPWEVRKPDKAVNVRFYGRIEIYRDEKGDLQFKHVDAENILAVPYDVPVIGSDTTTTNTLRLWSAEASDKLPSNMEYVDYLNDVEKLCLNLYPEDYSEEGKLTRIKQEYFFVCAGLHTIIRDHLNTYGTLDNLADKVTIQLNDTHPALAVPELMRILMDENGYNWYNAWNIVTKTFAYTNHTVLQEALEKWPVAYIQKLLPRIYLIIEEIDNQWTNQLRQMGKSEEMINSMRIISEGNVKMAFLSIVGSYSVNGVAKLHTQILKADTFKNFYEINPAKFNNKTNGVTQRRWFFYSNPELAELVTKTTGKDIKKDFTQIEELAKYVDDPKVQEEFLAVKHQKKVEFADYCKRKFNIDIDPDSIFDVQAKRLHAYKRQLLNIMHVIGLYKEIKRNPNFWMPKTTYIFGAKAAGTYYFAKKVIELINKVGKVIDNDPQVSKFIKVVFIPNYCVSIAEKLMPAADVSEQISTAGKEASGTGNMKFMMNGAITLGTLDGANVEINDLVGSDNIEIFGLKEYEVMALKPNYRPFEYYQRDPELREIINSFTDGTWTSDKNCFIDLANEFLLRNDEYLILADYHSYKNAHKHVNELYMDKNRWAHICLMNVAKSAFFSSDRTINDYVNDIWKLDKLK